MQESVIYQDILLKGEQRGKKQEALELILRQLKRRFGVIEPEVKQQVESLSLTDLEGLAESLLDFSRQNDLVNYLASLSPLQSNLQD